MGQIYDFEKEKLIVGVIYNDEEIYKRALEMLKAEFGEIDADGRSPSEPVITLASSVRMSPNIFSVTMTSKWRGCWINFIAALSTNIYSTSTLG